jgi:hypothetical protein
MSRIVSIPGESVKFPYDDYIKQVLSAVFDHSLELWAIVCFGRQGAINIGAEDSDIVLFCVFLAFAELSLYRFLLSR